MNSTPEKFNTLGQGENGSKLADIKTRLETGGGVTSESPEITDAESKTESSPKKTPHADIKHPHKETSPEESVAYRKELEETLKEMKEKKPAGFVIEKAQKNTETKGDDKKWQKDVLNMIEEEESIVENTPKQESNKSNEKKEESDTRKNKESKEKSTVDPEVERLYKRIVEDPKGLIDHLRTREYTIGSSLYAKTKEGALRKEKYSKDLRDFLQRLDKWRNNEGLRAHKNTEGLAQIALKLFELSDEIKKEGMEAASAKPKKEEDGESEPEKAAVKDKEAVKKEEKIESTTPEKPEDEKVENEETKIYKNPELDPAIKKVEKLIRHKTNNRVREALGGRWGKEAKEEMESGRGRVREESYVEMHEWDDFINLHPEKASGYRNKFQPITEAFERRKLQKLYKEQRKQEEQIAKEPTLKKPEEKPLNPDPEHIRVGQAESGKPDDSPLNTPDYSKEPKEALEKGTETLESIKKDIEEAREMWRSKIPGFRDDSGLSDLIWTIEQGIPRLEATFAYGFDNPKFSEEIIRRFPDSQERNKFIQLLTGNKGLTWEEWKKKLEVAPDSEIKEGIENAESIDDLIKLFERPEIKGIHSMQYGREVFSPSEYIRVVLDTIKYPLFSKEDWSYSELRDELENLESVTKSLGLRKKVMNLIDKEHPNLLEEVDYEKFLGTSKEEVEKKEGRWNKFKDYLNTRKEELDLEGKVEFVKKHSKKAVENYNKLSFKQKLAVSAGLMGVASLGSAVGGASGGAIIAAAFVGKSWQRALGGAAIFTGVEGALKKAGEAREKEGLEKRWYHEHAGKTALGAALLVALGAKSVGELLSSSLSGATEVAAAGTAESSQKLSDEAVKIKVEKTTTYLEDKSAEVFGDSSSNSNVVPEDFKPDTPPPQPNPDIVSEDFKPDTPPPKPGEWTEEAHKVWNETINPSSIEIAEGGNIWNTATTLAENHGMSQKELYEALGRSTAMIDGKEVPLLEVDLVHAGDSLALVTEPEPHFEFTDTPDDAFKAGTELPSEAKTPETVTLAGKEYTPDVDMETTIDVEAPAHAEDFTAGDQVDEPYRTQNASTESAPAEEIDKTPPLTPEEITDKTRTMLDSELERIYGPRMESSFTLTGTDPWEEIKDLNAKNVIQGDFRPGSTLSEAFAGEHGTAHRELRDYLRGMMEKSGLRPRWREDVQDFLVRAGKEIVTKSNPQ